MFQVFENKFAQAPSGEDDPMLHPSYNEDSKDSLDLHIAGNYLAFPNRTIQKHTARSSILLKIVALHSFKPLQRFLRADKLLFGFSRLTFPQWLPFNIFIIPPIWFHRGYVRWNNRIIPSYSAHQSDFLSIRPSQFFER